MLLRPAVKGRERGQIIVLFAMAIVVMLVFASMVVDVGLLRITRQNLVNTLDSAALAAGTKLPVDGNVAPTGASAGSQYTLANALIASTIQANYPGLPVSAYTIAYKCLVGALPNGQPNIARDIPGVCNPAPSLGRAPIASDFTGAGPTRVSKLNCHPELLDKCNTVVITGSATQNYSFGRVVGINSGSTGAVVSAACNGPCGAPPSVPVELIMIIDRTASMSATDVAALRAATRAVLSVYDPNIQRVGVGLTGPSRTTSTCGGAAGPPALPAVFGNAMTSSTGYGTNTTTDLTEWIPVGLSGAGAPAPGFNELYKNADGSLNASSRLVNIINCFNNPGGTGTNLAVPVRMAAHYLNTYGRAGVKKGIILETDGQPNYGVGLASDYTCLRSMADATAAKNGPDGNASTLADNIDLYTIGFGLDGSNNVACPDTSGLWNGKRVTELLAAMATGPSLYDHDNNVNTLPLTNFPPLNPAVNLCEPRENTDGDHFFCQPRTEDLTSIFTAVANQFAGTGAKLIQLHPTPVITSLSPPSGPWNSPTAVTINGKFFTGATSVRFGGASVAFTVVSDTSITATAPVGTLGSTVNVSVTTSGGTTPAVAGSTYTYNSP